jgi:hypothetical protein
MDARYTRQTASSSRRRDDKPRTTIPRHYSLPSSSRDRSERARTHEAPPNIPDTPPRTLKRVKRLPGAAAAQAPALRLGFMRAEAESSDELDEDELGEIIAPAPSVPPPKRAEDRERGKTVLSKSRPQMREREAERTHSKNARLRDRDREKRISRREEAVDLLDEEDAPPQPVFTGALATAEFDRLRREVDGLRKVSNALSI